MSDLLFKITVHCNANEVGETDLRERVEQALNIACSHLETFRDTDYVGYKIKEVIDLGEEY